MLTRVGSLPVGMVDCCCVENEFMIHKNLFNCLLTVNSQPLNEFTFLRLGLGIPSCSKEHPTNSQQRNYLQHQMMLTTF